MDILKEGMTLYHKTRGVRCKIVEIKEKEIVLDLDEEIANKKRITLYKYNIGEWIFFEKEHLNYTLYELADIEYYSIGKKVSEVLGERQKKLEEERAKILAYQEERKAEEEYRKREREKLELQKKKYTIEEIIAKRGVSSLVHFTRIENLESILELGFIPRIKLEKLRKSYIKNDEERREKMTNCTCFSVMFPNSYLFRKFREKNIENKWVVILVDANILLDANFKKFFCYNNAARGDLKEKLQEGKLTTAWDFEQMFKERDSYCRANGSGMINRNKIPGIRDFLPTSEQAEILISGIIPTSYIQEIVFENEYDLNLYKQVVKNYKYYINSAYFNCRNNVVFNQED